MKYCGVISMALCAMERETTTGRQLRLTVASVLVFDEARSRPQTMFLLAL